MSLHQGQGEVSAAFLVYKLPPQPCLSSCLAPYLQKYHATFAAAAKLLQSCPTLCDPIDGSPAACPVPGILQARTLEWVAISFSNAWKWKVKVKSLSRVRLLATPWTVAHQAPHPWDFPGESTGVGCCWLSKYMRLLHPLGSLPTPPLSPGITGTISLTLRNRHRLPVCMGLRPLHFFSLLCVLLPYPARVSGNVSSATREEGVEVCNWRQFLIHLC